MTESTVGEEVDERGSGLMRRRWSVRWKRVGGRERAGRRRGRPWRTTARFSARAEGVPVDQRDDFEGDEGILEGEPREARVGERAAGR